MKTKVKGILVSIFFGFILLTSTVMIGLPTILPEDPNQKMTETGTPLDNYPDVQREQFCSSNEFANSNSYVTEYKIPTPCTQPLAIVTDPSGNVWFAQTNTGNLGSFDPLSETFTEYDNTRWPTGGRSMMWGIDYSPDGGIWFTDEAYDAIWKFSIAEEEYFRTPYPSEGSSLPQRLSVDGSKIIVNDFTGNKLTFLDPTQSTEGLAYLTIPSPVEGSVSGGFTVDAMNNLWYTNWIFQTGGVLVKLDQEKVFENTEIVEGNNTGLFDYVGIYQFPAGMSTPNGISADSTGDIWIADTSSNYFFNFDPNTEIFTKYVTSIPDASTYGNSSGLIKTPVSRPYWTDIDDQDRLVFNLQTANRIGVFDHQKEMLVEYMVPSKNPNWADCEGIDNCGLAQVFDITANGDKIWFTEWVENNIGVVDTSKALPFEVELDEATIRLNKGSEAQINFKIIPKTNDGKDVTVTTSSTALFTDLTMIHNSPGFFNLTPGSPTNVQVTLTSSEDALPDIHKVLIGAQTDEVVISKYVTVIIE